MADEDGAAVQRDFKVRFSDVAFLPVANSLQEQRTDSLAWGDFNGDGRLDLLALDRDSRRPRLWLNLGGEEFALGDFDGDGDLDLAALLIVDGHEGPQRAGVLRHENLVTNQPPTEPAGLRAEFTQSGVELSWQQAADPQQPSGLSYNLRLGTAPGAHDVMSAESLPDGRRLIPGLGNNGWLTRRALFTLEPGRTYFWSVQAVDGAHLGGPFAPEQSFTLPDDPRLTMGMSVDNGARFGRFTLRARLQRPCVLERSRDLRSWQTVATLNLTDPSATEIVQPLFEEAGATFYRARYSEHPE